MKQVNHGAHWQHELRDWVTVDQNTRDPNSPDHSMNCGPAATCAMGRWMTGRHFDPEQLRIDAGDTAGEGTGTGPEIDKYFFRPDGPVPANVLVLEPQTPESLQHHIYEALTHGHPTKILQQYSPGGEAHFRVVHASWWTPLHFDRHYRLGDPWVGDDVVQPAAELWDLYLGLIIIPQRSRHSHR